MSIQERLMATGSWDIALKPDVPKTVRNLLDYYGVVYVFDSPLLVGLSDAAMIAAARWGGLVRRNKRNPPYSIGGPNLIWYLGDEAGNGPIIETAFTGTGATFAAFIAGLLPSAVTSGSLGAVPGTQTITYGGKAAGQTPVTPRQAIDNLCSIFGAEYRVNKDATFDAGAVGANALFKTTPTAVAMRRSSGRDQSIVGISTTQLDLAEDAEEYITRVLVQDSTLAWAADQSGGVAFRSFGTETDGTLSAWTFDVGTPTITANVATVPAGARMHAGSVWTDVTFNCRTQYNSAAGSTLFIAHFVDANNFIYLKLGPNAFDLRKVVAGADTLVTASTPTLTNGNQYWVRVNASGTTYSASLYTDVSGAIGVNVAGSNPSGTIADAAVQSGYVGLQAVTHSLVAGGAFPNVLLVQTPTAYKDLRGNPIQVTKVVVSSQTPNASAAALASNLMMAGSVLHQQVTLGTDQFDIERDVVVGDWIWVYDEDANLKDTTNPIRYRGSMIYPLKLRVLAITWPIERGMSVWYRSGAGAWTDLTNYVEFESPGAMFEVGAPVRALTKS